MQKLISSGESAINKIIDGVNLVANPVKSTISPLGRLVILSESKVEDYGIINYPPVCTKDGFRVSQSVASSDPETQVAVKMMQELTEKQVTLAGDGTSTVCLLTQKILEGGAKLIKDGANHVHVVKGMNYATKQIVEKLKAMAIPLEGNVELVRNVATVCSNNDTIIGDLIASAFKETGTDGIISIEESRNPETTIKISDGIKFGLGWVSSYFVNNKATGEAELINPYILVYDRPITILKDFMPLLSLVVKSNQMSGVKRPLMIFCDRCDGEALATLTVNNSNGTLQSCVVEMAYLGQHKITFMDDIAAFTGATSVNELKGVKLENVQISHLGQSKKVVVGKSETIIIEGSKDEVIYNTLVDGLKEQESKMEDGDEKVMLKRRIARLKGIVATLTIGGVTEIQMKEAADRAEDAVRSVGCSIEEGIIPGGGTAFIRCSNIEDVDKLDGDAGKGQQLIYGVLKSSLVQICLNSGINCETLTDAKNSKTLYETVLSEAGNVGYNVVTGIVEDLLKAGIVEPLKSNRCALENAVSLCCQILSSQYLITDTI